MPTERIDEVVHEDVLLLKVGARQGQARCELIVRLENCVCLGLWEEAPYSWPFVFVRTP